MKNNITQTKNIIKLGNTSLEIIEEDDKIILHSSKDIFLSSNGNIVSKANNYNVVFGKEVHLNPRIKEEQDIITEIDMIERLEAKE